ncbi:response regulator [Paraburkholderia sp. LEh10]|jgi:FixJ family two-component response regulator|uniref:response regulator transcription factor n=1 Tax=Paraburkholderia sp. LEh10 TaxID=2821353 RepID=UPI001AE189EE|nr:response regulator [Paraburkholderia sp. LEh10]MBP0595832.1 response regulator [Paraburkholderia sp. LEh10]
MDADTRFVAVVDDDTSVCRAIQRLLRSAGIAADIFPSGDEFLYALSATPDYDPGCVILDIQMPGTDGVEVQRRLGSKLPAIFITAYDDDEIRARVMAAGAQAYFSKPFDDSVFIQSVCAALGSQRSN